MRSGDAERLAAELLMIGLDGLRVTAAEERLIERGVRSFVLFARNIGSREEIVDLTGRLRELAGGEALIALDEEGGSVSRLRGVATQWPSAMACAASGDVRIAEDAACASAEELAALGFNLNFAPVADVMSDYRNPVLGTRVFSDDPGTVAQFVSAVVRGHRRGGMAGTAKHFPGHGATPIDSHLELPAVDRALDELRAIDLVPFEAAVREQVASLMISHVWYRGLDSAPTPATLSPRVLDIARRELRFGGVILTDCLEMRAIEGRMPVAEAAVGAVRAGCDIAVVSQRLDRQEEALRRLTVALEEGAIPPARAEEAAGRVRCLRRALSTRQRSGEQDGAQLAESIARRAVTLLRDRASILPLRLRADERLLLVTFPGRAHGAEGTRVRARIGDLARRRHANLIHLSVREESAGAETLEETASLEQALALAAEADATLISTAFATGRPFQAEVVERVAAVGRQVVVMAGRDPYDLVAVPHIPCYLAVYGETEGSLDAGLAVVFGEQLPAGRLPVALPGLYPRGYGLVSCPPHFASSV